MADFENDPLAPAFDEFRGDVAPFVHPAGAMQIHEKVRTRKRNHTIALATLAVVVVAIPAAAYAAVGGASHGPPPPPAASISVSPAPLPSMSPSASPSPSSASPTTPAKPPTGGIKLSTLNNATLDLPPWQASWWSGCPSGPQKFTGGSHYVAQSDHIWIDKLVYADVNQDGKLETVARLLCDDLFSTYQVVAFDQDAHGKIHTFGQVTMSAGTAAGSNGVVTDICDLRAGPNGSIQVQVVDFPMVYGCSQTKDLLNRWVDNQWRTFAWTGAGFAQSAGPTSFPPNPYASDLAVSNSDLDMVAAANGHYLGTMTVTVKNLGTEPVPYHTFTQPPDGMKLTSPTGCATTDNGFSCPGAPLAGGKSRTITLKFDSPSRLTGYPYIPSSGVSVDSGYADPVHQNNGADFKVIY